MYSDFRDQNRNPVAASVVLEAIKRPIIKHSVGIQIFASAMGSIRLSATENDIIRGSFTITNSCASDGIKLGSVNIGMAKVTIKNEKFAMLQSPSEIVGCFMKPMFYIEIDENTTVLAAGGSYWIKEVEQLTEGVRLTCYDSMSKLDEPFTLGTITGTPYQILTQAATACDVTVQSTQAEIEALPNGTRTFTLHSDNDCKTWRDVLSYLSMLMGCFVTIGNIAPYVQGAPGLVIRPFGNGKDSFCDTVTDVHRYKGAKFSIFDTEYKAIDLTAYVVDGQDTVKKDFTYAETTGVTGQTIKLGYNPFIQADTPETDLTQTQRDILHDLLTQVDKYAYTPMQISLPVGFIYDLGDVIKCTGGLANTGFAGGYTEDCYCCISNYTYTYGKEFRIKTLESKAAKARVITSPPTGHIFGVEWDGVSPDALTRTDSSVGLEEPLAYMGGATNYGSPFDSLMPWSGIERVTNAEAGELVKIPKFWFKLEISNEHPFKLQIADSALEGFYLAPAFMDRGDGGGERDFVYVGRYPCSAANYKSETGGNTIEWITRATARTNILTLGTTVWQWDYAMLVTIQMLYLVEYATWGIQTSIGAGSYGGSAGGTDAMPYHTGTMGESRISREDSQYRYIENLWHDGGDFVDGINFSGANVYSIKNPAYFSDDTRDVLVGTHPTSSDWISAFAKSDISEYEWFYFPSAVASIDDAHILATCNSNGGDRVLIAGGGSGYISPFSMECGANASYTSRGVGSRLMVLPGSRPLDIITMRIYTGYNDNKYVITMGDGETYNIPFETARGRVTQNVHEYTHDGILIRIEFSATETQTNAVTGTIYFNGSNPFTFSADAKGYNPSYGVDKTILIPLAI